MIGRPDDPLILTVRFSPEAFETLDALRRRYFPPARNIVPAHVTLFHKLPGGDVASIVAAVRETCAGIAPIDLPAPGLRFLGNGVAIDIVSEPLSALHAALAHRWASDLSAQDRQGFRPHVTIQNKVTGAEAHALYDELRRVWIPRTFRAEGLQLWRYMGGPWTPESAIDFRG